MTVISIYQDGVYSVVYLLPGLSFVWFTCKKVKMYLRTKFRQDASIHSGDTTISGFSKTNGHYIEILLPVSTLTFHHHWHVILR